MGLLSGDAHAIQVQLLEAQTQLNQLEAYTLAYDQALSKETLINEMNGCLNYRTIHGGDINGLGGPGYNNCETDFYSWVTHDAGDVIWALQPIDYSDEGIYNFFQNSPNQEACATGCPAPFAVDVNYLSLFPAKNPGFASPPVPALSNSGLANPNEVTLGVRAYLELAHEWPQYATQVDSSRLNGLIQVGTTLRQAFENANSINSGGTITPNQPLFTGLVSKYGAAVSNLQIAIQGIQPSSIVSEYLADPANRFTDPTTGITLNLWAGGANQHTSWRPPAGSILFCDGSGSSLPAPGNLFAAIPDLYAFSQGYLSSGQLSMCISKVQWGSAQTVVNTPAKCSAQSTNILDAFTWYPNYPGYNPNSACAPVLVSETTGGAHSSSPSYTWKFVPSDTKTFAQSNNRCRCNI